MRSDPCRRSRLNAVRLSVLSALLSFHHHPSRPLLVTVSAVKRLGSSVDMLSLAPFSGSSTPSTVPAYSSRSSAPTHHLASSSSASLIAPTSPTPLSERTFTTPHANTALATSSSETRFTVWSVVEQSSGVVGTVLSNPIGAAVAGITATSLGTVIWWRYFRRIPNAEYVTPAVLRYRKVLVGRVVTVGDADGFRFHHTPGPPLLRNWLYPWPPKTKRSKSSDGRTRLVRDTISVRIAGVDAPESGHFGKPAQPFSKEAKAFLTSLVQSPSTPDNLTPPRKSFFSPSASTSSNTSSTAVGSDISGKLVWLYPSHIDQYKRLVATPYIWQPPYIFGKTNVSLAMVKKGLATVYRAAGADYGKATWWAKVWRKSKTGLRALERAESTAR